MIIPALSFLERSDRASAAAQLEKPVKAGSGVQLTTLLGFCPEAAGPDDWSRVQVLSYDSCFALEDTVALAHNSLTDPRSSFAEYNLVTNNCEHFATFVKAGMPLSLQILAIRNRARLVLVVGG
jgi:hypothetical protein